jgi:SNF2 family DNA or RNA helicase
MNSPEVISKPSWIPHEYQERAIRLLLGQASGGLFLDPGLGKTSICLATFEILKQQGLAKRVLIVAPLRPCYHVWPSEIEKWAEFGGLTYSILHGPNKMANLATDADIQIINPEGLLWLFQQKDLPQWDVLIIDESTKFKNSTTKRFKLLKPLIPRFMRRWILTGTPCPNGLEDLFGQIYLLDLGRSLGRYISHFRMQFFTRSSWNVYEWTPQSDAFERVVELIRPLIIQLSAEDYLKMPELVYRNIVVDLPSEVMKTYREVEDQFITELEENKLVAANAAVAGIKCRQIANGRVYDSERNVLRLHEEKLDALESMVEEFNGQPTIVLYEFDHDRQAILERFPNTPVLGAGLSQAELKRVIQGFNAGQIPLILGHPASMGHGLNLQGACNHIIWYGITWNLEHYDQAIARVYRQGQENSHVFVYHIVAKDTLDERVLETLQSKDRTQQDLLGALA